MVPFSIETHHLSHAFHNRPVLHDLNLQVPTGSIFGFLGPNGSGKTTTIRLLLGLIRSPSTAIRLMGKDSRTHRLEILSRIGALIESPALYNHLSGRDNLEVIRLARQVDQKQIDRVLGMVQLTGDAQQKVRAYSLGMRQRLGIAMALLGDPHLLILDEPTNGLDPAGIREIRELLIELSQRHGKTVFVSSHLLGEMEKMATHLAILNEGHLLFQGTMAQLQHLQLPVLSLETDHNATARALLQRAGYQLLDGGTEQLTVSVKDRPQIGAINRLLLDQGVSIYKLHMHQPTLEDLFFTLTSHPKTLENR
ncbi:ABC transporter ATP-binding protein [Larkinella rosea]|uniref:ATP-binding cassette domain-containing protein n=1 Tax=Larkinella rosea TaxID=2025312 RepID=A0A3P1BJ51_9BACT|nr:ATP-binding cassette domain-containing protein [Larkinella rosea]RRB01150.1 ATP-binding cassette domain-containing protein [Larkinella rosea]